MNEWYQFRKQRSVQSVEEHIATSDLLRHQSLSLG